MANPNIIFVQNLSNKTFKKDSWKKNFNSIPFEIREKWLDKISEIDDEVEKKGKVTRIGLWV